MKSPFRDFKQMIKHNKNKWKEKHNKWLSIVKSSVLGAQLNTAGETSWCKDFLDRPQFEF